MNRVVIGLLCLAFIVAFGVSVAVTVQQISTLSSPALIATNREHGTSYLFDDIVYGGDPGGGTRPG